MTLIRFINSLLRPTGLQLCKKSKYRLVYGNDWIDDALEILHVRGVVPRIVMDIGANRGQTSKRLARAAPGAEVHCFEPTPASREVLQHKLSVFPNVRVHPLAFGREDGTAKFYLRAHHESNSFLQLKTGAKDAPPEESIDVEVRSLDSFAASSGWSDVHVLKINAEGFDLEILKGGGQMLAEGRIHLIFVEINFDELYDGQGGFLELHTYLSGLDYSLVGCYETASSGMGETMWTNGLYVKRMKAVAP